MAVSPARRVRGQPTFAGGCHDHRKPLARYGAMGGALARGLLRRVKPPTGVSSCCAADPYRNLSLIFVSHPRGALHHAIAAPNDYWGQQLRNKAAEEAKTCADLAARKEA